MANKDLPLTAEIVGGVVTITVGVSALCQIIRDSVRGGYFWTEPNITDEYAAARGVLAELTCAECGSTRLDIVIAEAAKAAVEGGADGISVPEPDWA